MLVVLEQISAKLDVLTELNTKLETMDARISEIERISKEAVVKGIIEAYEITANSNPKSLLRMAGYRKNWHYAYVQNMSGADDLYLSSYEKKSKGAVVLEPDDVYVFYSSANTSICNDATICDDTCSDIFCWTDPGVEVVVRAVFNR